VLLVGSNLRTAGKHSMSDFGWFLGRGLAFGAGAIGIVLTCTGVIGYDV
jgi:hypothetical protein